MIETDLNYLAILVAALAGIFIGAAYFSKPAFGPTWIRIINLKRKEEKHSMTVAYSVGGLAQIIMAFMLSAFIELTEATTWWTGFQTAFWLWLGFVATTTLVLVAWENKKWDWWAVFNGNALLTLLAMSLILVYWT